MNTEEFVAMTMAFADHAIFIGVADSSTSSQAFGDAREELRRHLHDSYTAAKLKAFADGMAYQKKRERATQVPQRAKVAE